ncbi:hypothetical protein BI364_06645 [Acidihalobacter yilgarnensis]|uniref:phosphomannomutase n=1 Tax=Acidihalobacter yilgarnensis TaxID=2819280 RepID=A0A1D8IMH3_9GAMM|nr:hypothetical protein [Acidihalobacter yilgarnensis]AOU97677.1 hypothetical protein BI364_06645 [Acidihalobacter yilgarnensis]
MNTLLEQALTPDGIRGSVNGGLQCGQVISIARAFGDLISPEGDREFLIGHDARRSSASLAEAVSIGLRSGGHHVTHIGLCATPMLRWYAAEQKFDGAVMITGGRLPAEYNGLKLYREHAVALSVGHGLEEVIARAEPAFYSGHACTPELHYASPLADYAAVIRSHCRTYTPIKVAIDAGNGIGGLDTRMVFSHLHTVRIWELDFEPDGAFQNRSPNPQDPGALDTLSRCVVTHGCHLGIAFDGDADALMVVDETGLPIAPDRLGGLIALIMLEQHPGGGVVHGPAVSHEVTEAIRSAGGQPLGVRDGGAATIQVAMVDKQALFGISDRGNYFYGDLYSTDNALRSLIELINGLADRPQPLSTLIQTLRLEPA